MPAQIEPGEFCASYWASYEVPGSKPGTFYRVTLYGAEQRASCTCKAYEFACRRVAWDDNPTCKHIDYVWKHACMWNCQWHDGNAEVTLKPKAYFSQNVIAEEKCPNCEGPVVAVLIAV